MTIKVRSRFHLFLLTLRGSALSVRGLLHVAIPILIAWINVPCGIIVAAGSLGLWLGACWQEASALWDELENL